MKVPDEYKDEDGSIQPHIARDDDYVKSSSDSKWNTLTICIVLQYLI